MGNKLSFRSVYEAVSMAIKPKTTTHYLGTLNGRIPQHFSYSASIFDSPSILQALHCVTNEVLKIVPRHEDKTGREVESSIRMLFQEPNNFSNLGNLLEQITYQILTNGECFCSYTYMEVNGKRFYRGLYCLNPQSATYMDDGTVLMRFGNGEQYTLPLDMILHFKMYQYSDEFNCTTNYSALYPMITAQNNVTNSLIRNTQGKIAGNLKINSLLDEEKSKQAIDDFMAQLDRGNAFLVTDLKTEFQSINMNTQQVDKETMEYLDRKILQTWNVSEAILNGDYTKEQYSAFINKAIAPLLVVMEQEFTRKLLTEEEKRKGDRIAMDVNSTEFMTNEEKIQFATLGSNLGILECNEIRALFGFGYVEDLAGVYPSSLNFVSQGAWNEYQEGTVTKDTSHKGVSGNNTNNDKKPVEEEQKEEE